MSTLVAYFSHAGENYGTGVIAKGNTEAVAESFIRSGLSRSIPKATSSARRPPGRSRGGRPVLSFQGPFLI